MIRFRFTEDERRYLLLLAESYRIIASQLPPAMAARVMRNLGKLEQMGYLEGIRQGLAIAELSLLNADGDRQSVRGLKAFQAHAVIYGLTDTPLRQVEQEWLDKLGVVEGTSLGPWLDSEPMRYAPQTLAEWEDEQAAPPHFSRLEDLDPKLQPAGWFDDRDRAAASIEQDEIELPPGIKPEGADSRQERPALLDQIRDVLVNANPKPSNWQELILHVHRATGIDAGFLDIQLSTDMGRTVLTQCGLHIDPGLGINLQELSEEA